MTIREKLLQEYSNETFDPNSKMKSSEDGRNYLPLDEKIRMLLTDYPNASIKCVILTDNNVFATVECMISTGEQEITAVGKWYHSNNDCYGMNYLSTAQSRAVAAALRLMGYSIPDENEIDPNANQNIGDIQYMENSNVQIPAMPPLPPVVIPNHNQNTVTIDTAKEYELNMYPFIGKTIGEILEGQDQSLKDRLLTLLEMHQSRNMELAKYAEVLLPIYGDNK